MVGLGQFTTQVKGESTLISGPADAVLSKRGLTFLSDILSYNLAPMMNDNLSDILLSDSRQTQCRTTSTSRCVTFCLTYHMLSGGQADHGQRAFCWPR